MSFLTIQTIRFWMTGQLPDAEGSMPADAVLFRPFWLTLILLGIGLTFFSLSLVLVRMGYGSEHEEEEEEGGEEKTELGSAFLSSFKLEVMHLLQQTTANVGAWCLLYTVMWILESQVLGGSNESILVRLWAAVLILYIALALIGSLPTIPIVHESQQAEGKKTFNTALGVAVGFAWERCFAQALIGVGEFSGQQIGNSLGEQSCGEKCEEILKNVFVFIFSVALAMFLFPALFWYITPLVMYHERLEEDDDDSNSLRKRKQTARNLEQEAALLKNKEKQETE